MQISTSGKRRLAVTALVAGALTIAAPVASADVIDRAVAAKLSQQPTFQGSPDAIDRRPHRRRRSRAAPTPSSARSPRGSSARRSRAARMRWTVSTCPDSVLRSRCVRAGAHHEREQPHGGGGRRHLERDRDFEWRRLGGLRDRSRRGARLGAPPHRARARRDASPRSARHDRLRPKRRRRRRRAWRPAFGSVYDDLGEQGSRLAPRRGRSPFACGARRASSTYFDGFLGRSPCEPSTSARSVSASAWESAKSPPQLDGLLRAQGALRGAKSLRRASTLARVPRQTMWECTSFGRADRSASRLNASASSYRPCA